MEWFNHQDRHFGSASEGAFYVIAFSCALRGEEVPITELCGIMKHREQSITNIPLM